MNITQDSSITIQLSQVTAGPFSTVDVSFGDASASSSQTYNLTISSPVNVTYNYTTPGTFTISATATPAGLSSNVTISINTLTVTVAPLPSYSSMQFIYEKQQKREKQFFGRSLFLLHIGRKEKKILRFSYLKSIQN
jgi:PKD repeat protein